MSTTPPVSVVMATYNRPPEVLSRTLGSIRTQSEAGTLAEILVVDDSSDLAYASWAEHICQCWGAAYIFLSGRDGYRNPAVPRNVGCRQASRDIIILQSDEVEHVHDVLSILAPACRVGHAVMARVLNVDGRRVESEYVGPSNPRPLFFCGAVHRQDLYAVGGHDEAFTEPGFEDDWLAACLMYGRGVTFEYRTDALAYHHDHPRPSTSVHPLMRDLYVRKCEAALRLVADGVLPAEAWVATGGPWMYP